MTGAWWQDPWVQQLGGVLVLMLAAVAANFLARRLVIPLIRRVISTTRTDWDDTLLHKDVIGKISWLAAAAVLYYGPQWLQPWWPSQGLAVLFQKVANSVIILSVALVIGAMIGAANTLYNRHEIAKARPVKGYLQIATIIVYCIAGMLILATLLDRPVDKFIAGLGAMTAVLLLVFKDTILSFVASLQLSSNDMLRVGDWLEMPSAGADGDVIDIALHTVKVQNWDKTISTIPTHRLISESFKNWRGMEESGGRRIKRAVHIDLGTLRFLDTEEVERFSRFELLREHMALKRQELAEDNCQEGDEELTNSRRRLTNLGTFRAWIIAYLKSRQDIHQDGMTFLVRQLPPGETGIPIEIYVFTKTTAWVAYEGIQADVFDYILAMVPEFGLRVFQSPTGADIAKLSAGLPAP